MVNFDASIYFNGTFRSYQQEVLDNVEEYLHGGQIHIVAAPGSGKTILGLELIRRLAAPALVLSPSVTIRQQWGERFEENFLSSNRNSHDLLSFRLSEPGLITSVTYQALHSAWTKRNGTDQTDEDDVLTKDGFSEDYSDFDLVETIRKAGIRTICLDEAHHLRSEWQKALEGFIKALGGEVVTISLTATPPYDSIPEEWNRYITLCGEVDAEIFVPQLVLQKTLCPHQDYVYFNYPSPDELKVIDDYRRRAATVVEEILNDGLYASLMESSGVLTQYREKEEIFLEYADAWQDILVLARYKNEKVSRRLIHLLTGGRFLPVFSMKSVEKAFQFILDHPEFFAADSVKCLRSILSHAGFIIRNRICLINDDRLRRTMVSSAGKLESISMIVSEEYKQLGDDLRMLILTDYIKKNRLALVGSDTPVEEMGTVPVFEKVRRVLGEQAGIAVLSGSLVIWPVNTLDSLMEIARSMDVSVSSRTMENVPYCELIFRGTNKHKVSVVTEAFRLGLCHVLIGTKSLLGEGWDSPCINSLILASFVGSFMLSNQMRGRAIRVDADHPGKTANIWHLVTLEPPSLMDESTLARFYSTLYGEGSDLISDDFDTLRRRFDCFMGPAYNEDGYITNGMERLDIIRPPYTEQNIREINVRMLALAADRKGMKERWNSSLTGTGAGEMREGTNVKGTKPSTRFLYINLLNIFIMLSLLYSGGAIFLSSAMRNAGKLWHLVVIYPAYLLVVKSLEALFYRILPLISPEKTIRTFARALLSALVETGIVKSLEAVPSIVAKDKGTTIDCSLKNASFREKVLFRNAMAELLSPVDDSRYLLIRREFILGIPVSDFGRSYACPSILGGKKENAVVFQKCLKELHSPYTLVYTRSEKGRKDLLKCRRKSYVNRNDRCIRKIRSYGE